LLAYTESKTILLDGMPASASVAACAREQTP
jgi:hypothetical protein